MIFRNSKSRVCQGMAPPTLKPRTDPAAGDAQCREQCSKAALTWWEFRSWRFNLLNHKDENSASASTEALAALGRCLEWFLHKSSWNCAQSALENRGTALLKSLLRQQVGLVWAKKNELRHPVCNRASVTPKISVPIRDPHPQALVCALQQWYLTWNRNIIIHKFFFCKKGMPGIILKCILLENSQPRKEDLGPASSTKYALICILFISVTRCFRISSTNTPIFFFCEI